MVTSPEVRTKKLFTSLLTGEKSGKKPAALSPKQHLSYGDANRIVRRKIKKRMSSSQSTIQLRNGLPARREFA